MTNNKPAPVNYLDTDAFKKALLQAGEYQKTAETLLSLPNKCQLGMQFETYVKDGNEIRLESVNVVGLHHVIARNPSPIGFDDAKGHLYNEWLIDSEVVRKNYGDHAISVVMESEGFTAHRKVATVKAIRLTRRLIEAIQPGNTGDFMAINVSWSDQPMLAQVGDYLTSGGYSISNHDMNSYEEISGRHASEKPEQKAAKNHTDQDSQLDI